MKDLPKLLLSASPNLALNSLCLVVVSLPLSLCSASPKQKAKQLETLGIKLTGYS